MGVLVIACSSLKRTSEVTSISIYTATHTRTPLPSPSATLTPSPTVTLSPSATPDVKPQRIITIGKGSLGDVARSPDGSMVAIIIGSTLQWYDAASGEQLGELGLKSENYSGILISPDNHWILISFISALIINTIDGSIYNCCGAENGFGAGFSFSEDSRYIAYISADRTTGGPYYSVDVYDITAHSDIQTQIDYLQATQIAGDTYNFLEANHSYPILNPNLYHRMSSPAISPDSRWLAAGYSDSNHEQLYIWNLQTGKIHFTYSYPAEVSSVDFSPDGRYLASGSDDGLVRLYKPLTGRLERTINGFTDSIRYIQFSVDSQQIIIETMNQTKQVYDLISGQLQPYGEMQATPDPILVSQHQQGYTDGSRVLFSPDGKSIAIGGVSIQIWDINTNKVISSLDELSL